MLSEESFLRLDPGPLMIYHIKTDIDMSYINI